MKQKDAKRSTPSTDRPRAAVYLRQSMDTREEELAVNRQRKQCLALAKNRRAVVAVTYKDNDVSASSRKPRPEFERMIAAAERGDIDVIVCQRLDRLLRKMSDLERLVEVSERTGVRIHLVDTDLDLSTDTGRLLGRILAAVARNEMEVKSGRQKLANIQRAEMGKPTTNRRRSFGYEQDGLTVVEHEAKLIREAYSAVLGGGSLYAIAQQWQASGVPTQQGGTQWRAEVVRRILLNARHAGKSAYKGEIVGDGTWPAIVDEATWEATHALLTDPRRRQTKEAPRRTRLLSGLVRCGVPGCGETVKANARHTDGAKTYVCRAGKHMARVAKPVEDWVSERVIARLDAPDAREVLADDDAPDTAEIRRQIKGLREVRDGLGEDVVDGLMSPEAARRGTARANAKIAELERLIPRGDVALIVEPLIGHAWELWPDLDLHRKRAVINALCVVTLYPLGRGNREQDPLTKIEIDWRSNPLAAEVAV